MASWARGGQRPPQWFWRREEDRRAVPPPAPPPPDEAFLTVVEKLYQTNYPLGWATTPEVQRSLRLLSRGLSKTEKEDLVQYGFIRVPSRQRPDRVYDIHLDGKVTEQSATGQQAYCIHVIPALPLPDVVLAMKWRLEADEAGWRKTANPVGAGTVLVTGQFRLEQYRDGERRWL